MNYEQLIEKWHDFIVEWRKGNTVDAFDGFENPVRHMLKPQFYDFMEWLSQRTPTHVTSQNLKDIK